MHSRERVGLLVSEFFVISWFVPSESKGIDLERKKLTVAKDLLRSLLGLTSSSTF